MKKNNISIIGLGYVGLPLLATISKKTEVFGYDNNKKHISNLKKRKFNFTEPGLAKTIENSLNKKDMVKENDAIYFSTSLGFQGLESKVVIYLDPLEEEAYESPYTTNKAHMLLFNAMGRANTILYLLWDKSFETWYTKRLRLLGNLMSKNEN